MPPKPSTPATGQPSQDKSYDTVILEYLGKRGFAKAEQAMRGEIAAKAAGTAATPDGPANQGKGKSVGLDEFADRNAPAGERQTAGAAGADGQPAGKKREGQGKNLIRQPSEYAKGYEGLREFVNNSLDIHRPSFVPFLLPLFVHSYLDLVVDGKREAADDFLQRFSVDHSTSHPSLVTELASLRNPYHVTESETAQRWRKERFVIRISERAKNLLAGYFQAEALGGDTDESRAKDRVTGTINERVRIEYINASLTASFPCGLASDFTDSLSGAPVSRSAQASHDSRIPELKLGPAPQDPKLAREVERITSEEGAKSKGADSGDVTMTDVDKTRETGSATPAPPTTTAPSVAGGTGDKASDPNATPPIAGSDGLVAPSASDLPPYPPSFRTLDIKREVELVRAARKRIRLGPEAYEAGATGGAATAGKTKASATGAGAADVGGGVGKPSVLLCTVHDAGETMTTARYSDDTTLLAAGFSESYIKLWNLKGDSFEVLRSDNARSSGNDAASLKKLRKNTESSSIKLIGHSGPVYSLSFDPVPGPSAPPRYLLSSSQDATVRLWSLETYTNLVAYRGHRDPIWAVEWGPKGIYFATGGRDRTARLWSTERTSALRIFAGHLSDVDCLAFHPNSLYLATGSSDRTCRLWDVQRGACVRIFTGHSGPVSCVAVSPDGRYLASAGEDQTVKLWDLGSSKLIKTMRGHRATIHSLSFSAESTVLVSGGADETVRVWDVSASSFPSSSTTSASAVAAAAAVARGAAAGSKASGESSNVLKKLSEGNLMDGKAGSTVGLLPQSSYTQDGIKDTNDLLATLPTKRTPIFDVQFTPRNLCLAAGPMLVDA